VSTAERQRQACAEFIEQAGIKSHIHAARCRATPLVEDEATALRARVAELEAENARLDEAGHIWEAAWLDVRERVAVACAEAAAGRALYQLDFDTLYATVLAAGLAVPKR
jgi:uncharacterized protein YPO0396